MRVLTVLGTRPEAVKLAPVLHALAAAPGVTSRLCSTGQHRELLAPALACFGLRPDHDLALMRAGQGLDALLARAVEGVGAVIAAERPDWVVVQGDTTTTLAAALAAFHAGVAVAHVEAGLRTRDLAAPWPEEGNRQLVARLARRHFAPTAGAAANLRAEGIPASAIEVTGNTVIDALRWLEARLDADQALGEALAARLPFPAPGRRLILATGHRREPLGGGLARVCAALRMVAAREDVEIVFLVHRNPAVGETARTLLGGLPRVHLLEPQDPLAFLHLLRRADLVVTDSGGVLEEAAGVGRPVLVTREATERPEAVACGLARVVGTRTGALVAAIDRLLDDPAARAEMAAARNPFGDGRAAQRIVARLRGLPAGALPPASQMRPVRVRRSGRVAASAAAG